MTNAEPLAKFRAEIDKLYGEYKDKFHQCGDQYHLGLIDGLDMAERVLDTLEESEKPMNQDEVVINGHKVAYDKDKDAITMEEIPKDLEEAARKHSCYDEDCEGAWYEPIVRNAFIILNGLYEHLRKLM